MITDANGMLHLLRHAPRPTQLPPELAHTTWLELRSSNVAEAGSSPETIARQLLQAVCWSPAPGRSEATACTQPDVIGCMLVGHMSGNKLTVLIHGGV